MWLYHRVMSPNDADGMANSVDPDQTDCSLIRVCTVCSDLCVRKLRLIMVYAFQSLTKGIHLPQILTSDQQYSLSLTKDT